MSLVEFLAISGAKTWQERALAALYWHAHFRDQRALSSSQVKAALQAARVARAKQANISDVMNKAGALVDVAGSGVKGELLWTLTPTGEAAVRRLAGLPEVQPEIEHGVEELQKVAARVADPDTRAYVEEAVLCLSLNALRAAVVFMWVGAVRVLQDRVWAHGSTTVEASAQKYYPKARIAKFDDLAAIRESTLLDVARDLGVVDKAEWTILGQCLDTRNQCGHPGKYKPGVSKAKSHIEDIVGILFN